MKTLIFILFLPMMVIAGERCKAELPTPTVVNQTTVQQEINNELNRQTDVTLGIANNHQFNIANPKLQWSVTTANYKNSTAISGALGLRVPGTNTFIHFSITTDDEIEDEAYFAGASGTF